MKTIILIHGAWHSAWCWNKVIPLIQASGARVIAPEISWEDSDTRTVNNNAVSAYVEDLCKLVTRGQEPVILAAHSLGGVVISQLAEYIPDYIESTVYISGFLLKDGQCINDTEHLMSGSLVQPKLKLSADNKYLTLPQTILRQGFYADCSVEDINFAIPRLRPQPVSSFMARVRLTQENFGTIPRIYIECQQDMAIPLSAQRAMYTDMGCDTVHSLESSHSPFFSKAESLAGLLTGI
jgi:pimeloyl-ACP methyl ester carboxylesterase